MTEMTFTDKLIAAMFEAINKPDMEDLDVTGEALCWRVEQSTERRGKTPVVQNCLKFTTVTGGRRVALIMPRSDTESYKYPVEEEEAEEKRAAQVTEPVEEGVRPVEKIVITEYTFFDKRQVWLNERLGITAI
jgi:hypothetical protein